MSWADLPGYVSERESFGETTVTVETEQIREACLHARDELGFDMCVDVVATDYLDWGAAGVSGYIGTAGGRDLAHPATQGLQTLPAAKPKRFSLSYHLLALQRGRPARPPPVLDRRGRAGAERRLGVADLRLARARAVRPDGHPLRRAPEPDPDPDADDDWEGHPLRKDYPIGGEPVRFTDAE